MENNEEIWKAVYLNNVDVNLSVSNKGNAMNSKTGKLRPMRKDRCGYMRVSIQKTYIKIHRQVALLFVNNPEDKKVVNHLDGDKCNNNYYNLMWETSKGNSQHAGAMGLLSRGRRKLPSKPIGKFIGNALIKRYESLGSVTKDSYPRISVTRAMEKQTIYRGYNWKLL